MVRLDYIGRMVHFLAGEVVHSHGPFAAGADLDAGDDEEDDSQEEEDGRNDDGLPDGVVLADG